LYPSKIDLDNTTTLSGSLRILRQPPFFCSKKLQQEFNHKNGSTWYFSFVNQHLVAAIRFKPTTVRNKSHHNRDSTNDNEEFTNHNWDWKKTYYRIIAELVDQPKIRFKAPDIWNGIFILNLEGRQVTIFKAGWTQKRSRKLTHTHTRRVFAPWLLAPRFLRICYQLPSGKLLHNYG
jgi:hypothetical protein